MIFVNGVKMFFIIEGVSGAGKSCLLNALQKLFVTHYPKATKLFISEHFTQRSLEHLRDGKSLASSAIEESLDATLSVLEGFDQRLNQSKFAHNPMLLQGSIERFHLTYLTEGWIDLKLGKKIATRLSKLECQQVILKIPPSLIEERIFSTVKYRNVEWEKYLSSLGSKKEVTTYFSKWQERLHAYAQVMEKFIPTLYLDTKEQNWNTLAKTLYDLTTNE